MYLEDSWGFYKDKDGDWNWRRITFKGKLVAASQRSYTCKDECVADARANGYDR